MPATTQTSESLELGTREPPHPSSSLRSVQSHDRTSPVLEDGRRDDPQGSVARRNEIILAPVDRGISAWLFLTGAFFVGALVWGFPTAYGIFLVSYTEDPRFRDQKHASSLLPLIGTLSSGIIYCSGPIINPGMARYPQHRRSALWTGLVFCWASLFGASYATRVVTLVALQGVLYAIGGALLYAPCISYLSEWFVNRRGLANGIIFAGTALGGLILPLIIPPLLRQFGIATSLRILSIAIVIVLTPLLPFIKPRLPENRVRGPAARSIDRSWLKNDRFWLMLLANTIQAFAYFVPMTWLPTFASDLRLGDSSSALSLALLNGSSVVGRIGIGALSDTMDSWLLAFANLTFTSLVTFVLWGVLAHSLPGLLVFSVAYGTIAGGWSSTWSGFIRPLCKDDPTLHTSIFGFLQLTRGLGNILSNPISTSMYNGSSRHPSTRPRTGYTVGGGRFEQMIIYVGTCFACAALTSSVGWLSAKYRSRTPQS
ncbi:MFS general substrate transporter [Punctularia strigosozonata HHB-11173 SS5]|uniref:MFS general substrate transporter n=1 Tax=Punctularia strigosozonata (strain HHB-11173) TaxID=741275 RepID=UPI000441678F|nr:MFS general substrate transporter [Punctularia strigosozonata HHB-11173 SS5]EIN12813.1 MFS general substrate transporter [Punctularia strigosozonata HHB-11173 SS5]